MKIHERPPHTIDPKATDDIHNKEEDGACLPEKNTEVGGGEDINRQPPIYNLGSVKPWVGGRRRQLLLEFSNAVTEIPAPRLPQIKYQSRGYS